MRTGKYQLVNPQHCWRWNIYKYDYEQEQGSQCTNRLPRKEACLSLEAKSRYSKKEQRIILLTGIFAIVLGTYPEEKE